MSAPTRPVLRSGHEVTEQGRAWVPRISSFLGVSVHLHWRDHGPPHVHAVYAEYEASISIEGAAVLSGSLPPRVLGLVIEWIVLRRGELRYMWQRAEDLQPLGTIEPLE